MVEREVVVTVTGHYKITEASIKDCNYGAEAAELLAAGKIDEAFEAAIELDRDNVEEGGCAVEELYSSVRTWKLEWEQN